MKSRQLDSPRNIPFLSSKPVDDRGEGGEDKGGLEFANQEKPNQLPSPLKAVGAALFATLWSGSAWESKNYEPISLRSTNRWTPVAPLATFCPEGPEKPVVHAHAL